MLFAMRAKTKVVADISFLGFVPVVGAGRADQIIPVCEALVAAGASIIELSFSLPDLPSVFKAAAQHFGQRALLGLGSITDAKTARAAVDLGAEFIVSPITKLEVVAVARAALRTVMLGAYTPTEAALANDAGADFVRLAPADFLGPGYVKSIRTFMPQLKLVPAGGIGLHNAASFIRAGAVAVGVGSSLLTPAILKDSNWPELTRSAAELAQAVKAAKEHKEIT